MGQRNRTACKSELIAAIPAAADAPVRKLAGSGQNIAGTAETPICAKQNSAMTMKGLETSPGKPIPTLTRSGRDKRNRQT
jgi:hypothetical protein